MKHNVCVVSSNRNSYIFNSLDDCYLNLLKHVDIVVGNSSSGLYEAPSFGIPKINIGDRQKDFMIAAGAVVTSVKPSGEKFAGVPSRRML